MRLIGLLAKNNGFLAEHDAFEQIKEPRVRVMFYIDEGMRLQLLSRDLYDSRHGLYRLVLTEKGRRFAVDAKFV